MKKLFKFSILLALAVTFTACGKKEDPKKSNACEMISFKDGSITWDVSGNSIVGIYPKGSNVSSISPAIEVSKDATVSPASGVAQDFSNGKTVKYTVTAQDGKSSKTYTAQAEVSVSN